MSDAKANDPKELLHVLDGPISGVDGVLGLLPNGDEKCRAERDDDTGKSTKYLAWVRETTWIIIPEKHLFGFPAVVEWMRGHGCTRFRVSVVVEWDGTMQRQRGQ